MSLSPLTYEVVESEGIVNVVVTKTGNFQRPIAGTLTTSTGSAGGMIQYIDLQTCKYYCAVRWVFYSRTPRTFYRTLSLAATFTDID